MPCRRRVVQGEGKRSSAGVGTDSGTLPLSCFAHIVVSASGKPIASPELELDHDGHPDTGFVLSQVWAPKTRRITTCRSRRGCAVHAGECGRVAVVAER